MKKENGIFCLWYVVRSDRFYDMATVIMSILSIFVLDILSISILFVAHRSPIDIAVKASSAEALM